jgi:hypothetical protein
MSDLDKAHPWKPGTLVKTCGKDIPLFKTPRAGSFAFLQIPPGELVMYVDCEANRMYKVVYGENIGWTYSDAVTTPR